MKSKKKISERKSTKGNLRLKSKKRKSMKGNLRLKISERKSLKRVPVLLDPCLQYL